MSKVVCINDEWVPDTTVAHLNHPRVGDYDTVIQQEVEAETDYLYYKLEGHAGAWYRASHFIDLPDAEPSTVTEEETQLVTA